jgi:hypothetical protein
MLENFGTPDKPNVPDYAILSHRWGKQELSLQELKDRTPEMESTEGFRKIQRCCQEAASVGFEYVWIDTCCMDKTDQVEITEALNSMFQWYRSAQVCYTYMSDVDSKEDPRAENSSFRKSQWFKRGWTLQELLAPQYVIFFDADWNEIGTKSSLQELITEISGIPSQVLLMNHGGEISIAQRMSWAAKRETQKVEDKAYCLLGLFGVSMPMIYGEGEKAFHRLQVEIMKLSDDASIFAWTNDSQGAERGLLATSPAEFKDCADVRRYGASSEFSVTNKGISMKLPLIPHGKSSDGKKDVMLGVLSCQRKQGVNYPDRYPLAIYLESQTEGELINFHRVYPGEIQEIREDISNVEKSEFYVPDTDPSRFEVSNWMKPESEYNFYISHPRRAPHLPRIEELKHAHWIISPSETRLFMGGSGTCGTMIFVDKDKPVFAVCLGVHNYNVWCGVTDDCEDANIKRISKEWWDGKKENDRWDNMDRRELRLEGGKKVRLAIRKGRKEGKRAYFIEVSVEGEIWLDKVGPGVYPGWWTG